MLVNKRCTYCGKKFQAQTTKTRYCSHACNQKHYKQIAKKERLQETGQVKEVDKIAFVDKIEIVKAREYLSIEDCALLLNVSRSSIKRIIENGELLCFNVLSRVLIARRDLETYCRNELKKPKFKEKKEKPISKKAKHFNKDNYYYMGEILNYYDVSLKSVERHIKTHNIEKVKKGRFSYVLKSDIKKLFGSPLKKQ